MANSDVYANGIRFFKDREGKVSILLIQNGSVTPLEPAPGDEKIEPGFYDFDMKPMNDPTLGNADA